jgi:hypothetical protein
VILEGAAMRGLIWLVVLASLAWGGYWVVGSRAVEQGAVDWFATQNNNGLIAENKSLAVRGFPNRFDLTVTEPLLLDPDTGYGWRAPFVQLFALSYQPWKVIAAFPPEQTISVPGQDIALTSAKLQASASLAPSSPLGVERSVLVGDDVSASSTLGWTVSAETLRFATRALDAGGLDQEIGLEALGVAPGPAIAAALPDLPPALSKIRVDAVVAFLPGQDGETSPRVSGFDVKEVLITWGDFALFGKGRIAANDLGIGEGRIELRLTNWKLILPLAVASGAISPEALPTWERALGLLAQQSGDGSDLVLPLTMQQGRMSLGPVPIGPAPRLN